MNFLECLAKEIEKTGHFVKREDSALFVEPLKLKVEAKIGERSESNNENQFSVTYQIEINATHKDFFPDGIYECTVGIGRNDDEAFLYAAENWTWTIFLLIHEIIVNKETEDFNVPRLDLVTRNEDTGEEFAWKLFLGELQFAGEFVEKRDTFDETILVQKILGSLSAELLEKKLFWVKIYLSKLNDEIIADCWLNNHNWIAGLNDLFWYAEEWKEVKMFAALKQFLIIKPCEIEEISNIERLRKSLPPIKKKSFFNKLFGK